MKSLSVLPEGYQAIYAIDLQHDKKLALGVNVLSVLIGVLMGVSMHFYVPITTLFSFEKGFIAYLLRFGVLLISIIAYMILHEFVHGIAMKLCGTKKVKYGFTGLYAFAGSDEYYDKNSYVFIALAPVVIWGLVLAVLNCFVSTEWFWVIYVIQIMNISGAAGDYYVSIRFSKFPKNILIRDNGVSMMVFSKKVKQENGDI